MTHALSSRDSGLAGTLNIQNSSLDRIVEDYCGITINELAGKDFSDYETGLLWSEMKAAKPTTLEKMLVEMLHLAYTRGEEL
ncbi:hypothetical protein [Methanolacinia paynteri]|uniref:hypothetical protein n=1 Tax=Methanolacinia paynteri TaxID=230356 RepID=UPI0012F65FC4|nr:hypothetical protein [Methanolacinia paynteri]